MIDGELGKWEKRENDLYYNYMKNPNAPIYIIDGIGGNSYFLPKYDGILLFIRNYG